MRGLTFSFGLTIGNSCRDIDIPKCIKEDHPGLHTFRLSSPDASVALLVMRFIGKSWKYSFGFWLLSMLLTPSIHAQAVGTAIGSLGIEITSPMVLDPDLDINRVGTIELHGVYPSSANGGNGSLIGMGSASCSPPGCGSGNVGLDLEIHLANDVTATANVDGFYSGAEDAFSVISVNNQTGVPQTVGLRFTSEWSISATAANPAFESAKSSIDISWAIPSSWCIQLESCPSGSLTDMSPGTCPAGYVVGGGLVLGNEQVNTSMGNASASAPVSICDVNISVPDNTFDGGGVAVYSVVEATSCETLILSNNNVTQSLTEEGCKVQIGPDYTVTGPAGDLIVNAFEEISIVDEFSIGVGSQLTMNIVGYPDP
ncbi:MAG: hypothetical protein KDC80_26560 [Saprospiraceae bacterium]|nr:hypothetical protein [Saprospiraceae bacterium]